MSPPKLVSSHCSIGRTVAVTTKTSVISLQQQKASCRRHHQNLRNLIAAAVGELSSSPPKLPSSHCITAAGDLSPPPPKFVSSHCSSSERAVVVTTKTSELSSSPPKLPSSHCSSSGRAVVVTTKTCVISLQQQWASCRRHYQNLRNLIVLQQRVICLRHHQNLCPLIVWQQRTSCRRHYRRQK